MGNEKQEKKDVMCECSGRIRTMLSVGDGLWKCPRCGGFMVGMTEVVRKRMRVLDEALEVLGECDKYLEENKLNNIGNKSTLHMSMKDVLKR